MSKEFLCLSRSISLCGTDAIRKDFARGLCKKHYVYWAQRIRYKKTTWIAVVEKGLARAVKDEEILLLYECRWCNRLEMLKDERGYALPLIQPWSICSCCYTGLQGFGRNIVVIQNCLNDLKRRGNNDTISTIPAVVASREIERDACRRVSGSEPWDYRSLIPPVSGISTEADGRSGAREVRSSGDKEAFETISGPESSPVETRSEEQLREDDNAIPPSIRALGRRRRL